MRSGREWLMRVGLAVATATAALPLRDIESGQRAVGALLGDVVDCADGVEPINSNYLYDAIVVLGAGQLQSEDGLKPSYFGEMRLMAAVRLYTEDVAPFIIIPDGNTAAVEIAYLQHMYQSITGSDTSIPEDAILVGEHAINTAQEMEEVAAIAATHGIHLVIVDTNDFHRERATLSACANGIAASSVAAEQVILEHSPERTDELTTLYNSPMMERIKAKEAVGVALYIVDSRGFAPTLIREITSP